MVLVHKYISCYHERQRD